MSNSTNVAPSSSSGVLVRLSIMMFLQFFAWGAWFATLAFAMGDNGLGDFIGGAFESAPIGAIIAPLFLGLIADRLFASEKVMGVLMLLGGVIMCGIALVAPQGAESGNLVVWLMIAYMLCYMPTLGLGNTITFTHLPPEKFPQARVWGTIGWIVAGLMLGFAGWSNSLMIFWLGALSSILLGLYSFTLPSTPPPDKGKPIDVSSLLMVDAWKLLGNFPFFVFAICSMLLCIPLGYYYGNTSPYLGAAGFQEPASTMTIGQMSEIIFMILIPFFFRKLGVKAMLLVAMACWIGRYLLFAYGAPSQTMWMLLLGVALHGICYDFFFVTGFMYTDKKAPANVRGQAQSLLVFLTQGLGLFFGFRMAFGGTFPFTGAPLPNTYEKFGVVPGAEHGALTEAIKVIKDQAPETTFLERLMQMFGKGYPEGMDAQLIEPAMTLWHNYWLFPAAMATVIFVVFAIAFWDRVDIDEEVADEPKG